MTGGQLAAIALVLILGAAAGLAWLAVDAWLFDHRRGPYRYLIDPPDPDPWRRPQ